MLRGREDEDWRRHREGGEEDVAADYREGALARNVGVAWEWGLDVNVQL